MKTKIYIVFTLLLALLFGGCTSDGEQITPSGKKMVLRGYAGEQEQTRTSFDEAEEGVIPFVWSVGDKVWVEGQESQPIAERGESADFLFESLSGGGNFKVYYNMAGEQFDNSNVAITQTQTEPFVAELGANGDFGYSTTDQNGNFVLEHKAAYLWFSPYSNDIEENNLTAITVAAPSGYSIAGLGTFTNGELTIVEGSNVATLTLGSEGFALPKEPSTKELFASMVVYPSDLEGETVKISYTFADGTSFTDYREGRAFVEGKTQRIEREIKADDLTQIVLFQADGGEWSEELPEGFTKLAVKTEMSGVVTEEMHKEIAEAMGAGGELDFSEAVNIYPVMLNYYAKNSNLSKITLPQNITTVGKLAFESCGNLSEVVLHEGIETIEQEAFYLCTLLNNLVLPETLTSLGRSAFYSCSSLEELTIPDGVEELGGTTFSECSALRVLNLSANLRKLGWNEFLGCSSLEKIEIPSGVTELPGSTSLRSGLFRGCKALKEVVLHEGLITIGAQSFYDCWALEKLNIPSTVVTIGEHALYDLRALKSIYLDAEIIGNYSMWTTSGESNLEEIVFGPRIKSLGRNAFLNTRKLATIRFESEECPTIVSDLTFGSSGNDVEQSLRKIYIPAGTYASYSVGLSKLVSENGYTIVEEGGAEELPDGVYYSSTAQDGEWVESLDEITGNYIYVKTVGSETLTAAALKAIDTRIEKGGVLTVLDMSEAVYESNKIPDMLFGGYNGNPNLFEISFPKNIEIIGTNVAGYSSGLRAVILGDKVTEIGEYSFVKGYSGDNRVAFVCKSATPPFLSDDGYPAWCIAFGGGSNLPMYVPDSSVEAYGAETKWSQHLIETSNIVIKPLSELGEYWWREELK